MNLSRFDFASEVNFLFPERERDFPNGKERMSLSFISKKTSQTAKPPEKPDASSQVRHPNLNEGAEEGEAGSQVRQFGPASVRLQRLG